MSDGIVNGTEPSESGQAGAPGLSQGGFIDVTSSGSGGMFTPWGKFSPWGQGDDKGEMGMSQQSQGTASGLSSPQSGQQQPSGFGVQQGLGAGMIGATNGGGGLPQWQSDADNMGLLQRQDSGLSQRGASLGGLGGAASPSGLGHGVSGSQGFAAALQEATWSLKQATDHIEALTSESGALRQALSEVTGQLSKMESESREVRARVEALESAAEGPGGGSKVRVVELVAGDANTVLPVMSLCPGQQADAPPSREGANFYAKDGADKWCNAVQEQYHRWVKHSGKVSEADFLRAVDKALLVPEGFPYEIAVTKCSTWEEARSRLMLLFPGPFPSFETLYTAYASLRWNPEDGVKGLAGLESKMRMTAARLAVGSADGGAQVVHATVLALDFLNKIPAGLRSLVVTGLPALGARSILQVREEAERRAPRWLATQPGLASSAPRTAASVVAAGVPAETKKPAPVASSAKGTSANGVTTGPAAIVMGKPGVGGGGTSDSAAGVVCWKCQQPGHRSRACPAQREMRRCHRCLQTGHLAAGCTVPRARLPDTSRKGNMAWSSAQD